MLNSREVVQTLQRSHDEHPLSGHLRHIRAFSLHSNRRLSGRPILATVIAAPCVSDISFALGGLYIYANRPMATHSALPAYLYECYLRIT